MSVLLCITITPIRISFIMERLSPKLHWLPCSPSSQPLGSTLLAGTTLLRNFHCPHFTLYRLLIGTAGFLYIMKRWDMACPWPPAFTGTVASPVCLSTVILFRLAIVTVWAQNPYNHPSKVCPTNKWSNVLLQQQSLICPRLGLQSGLRIVSTNTTPFRL